MQGEVKSKTFQVQDICQEDCYAFVFDCGRPFQGRSSWGWLDHPRYFNSCGRREQKRERDNQLQQLETKKMPQKVFQRYFLCCRLHLEKRAISNLCWFFLCAWTRKKSLDHQNSCSIDLLTFETIFDAGSNKRKWETATNDLK